MEEFLLNTKFSTEGVLGLGIKLTGAEFASLYMCVEESYFLLKFVHACRGKEELICTFFDFEQDKLLSAQEITAGFTAKNFVLRDMIAAPIFQRDKKLGLLLVGNKGGARPKKKDKKTAETFSPRDFVVLGPVKALLRSFLEAEKYRHLYENKLFLGSSDFSRDLLLVNMTRAPLNGIISYNKLLSKTKLDEVQNKYLTLMNHCCFQLMQIINDALDYAKLSTHSVSLNEERFSVNDLRAAVENILGAQLKSKKQTMKFSVRDSVPEFIFSDRPKILQILVNLLSNAHKFSGEGAEIKVVVELREGDFLLFEVRDQGAGISEEDQAKLFHVFTQLKSASAKVGTGLGLAVSQKLTELLLGVMWVRSAPGEGSSFYFTVKFSDCEDFEKVISQKIPLLEGKYVLVVDGDAANRMLLADYLFEWKMVPVPVASGAEAVRLIINNRYPFCVGLIDICMPSPDGPELAKLIKGENPHLPLVGLSSADSPVGGGIFDFRLDKPLHKFKLFNCIAKLVASPAAGRGKGPP